MVYKRVKKSRYFPSDVFNYQFTILQPAYLGKMAVMEKCESTISLGKRVAFVLI
jgi:hypothetical protein